MLHGNGSTAQDNGDSLPVPPDTETTNENNQPTSSGSLFYSPKDGCTKIYQCESYLQNHILWGTHDYTVVKTSLADFALNSYKHHIDQMELFQNIPV